MAELDVEYEAQRTLKRIRPKILEKIDASTGSRISDQEHIELLDARLDEHWPRLFALLYRLYGGHYDFFYYLENILLTAVDCWLSRPDDLYNLDLRRENDPGWYLSERMIGGSLYVDLFSGDLTQLRDKIPYLKDLGLGYLHLMPLFSAREGNSDGGYAINDYRTVDPELGTVDELQELAADLRQANISLVLDFVFNHTADDHQWAIQAQQGDREYENYYHIYPDRSVPDQYERNLREIFPTVRRGNFSWHEGMQRWIWTTFNSFQWDLKYSNPEVFRAMAAEMLYLANTGVEILRLDAVAFIWKKLGTSCENLPEAHLLIQAFNAVCRIAAPGLVFKSEAIVHPDDVVRYISRDECQLSYNPTLMALLWESTATRKTNLLKQSLSHRHTLPAGTSWVNYLRGHDDIGWSFDNYDAQLAGIDPDGHRDFLNRFYTGMFPGSFAAGVPFQFNEETNDMRISGTMASLAGIERALVAKDQDLLDLAVRRIRMLYGVLFSIGGLPLLFMGEEWGLLNDYSYLDDDDKKNDSRWIHRPRMDWAMVEDPAAATPASQEVNRNLRQLIKTRQASPALRGNHMRLLPVGSLHLLCYLRWHDANQLVVLANFSDRRQSTDLNPLRHEGLSHFMRDLFTDATISTHQSITLPPYELLWLVED